MPLYFSINESIEVIDLLDNKITENGCQKISEALLNRRSESKLNKFSIDHNPIGDNGF